MVYEIDISADGTINLEPEEVRARLDLDPSEGFDNEGIGQAAHEHVEEMSEEEITNLLKGNIIIEEIREAAGDDGDDDNDHDDY